AVRGGAWPAAGAAGHGQPGAGGAGDAAADAAGDAGGVRDAVRLLLPRLARDLRPGRDAGGAGRRHARGLSAAQKPAFQASMASSRYWLPTAITSATTARAWAPSQ